MPEIGPVTAVGYVATLDDAGRFRGAHQVEAYLGLVPREWSSSEVQRRGHITKAGNSRMRWLLVEAAWRLITHKKRPETQALREWAERIARRRGQRVAMVYWACPLHRAWPEADFRLVLDAGHSAFEPASCMSSCWPPTASHSRESADTRGPGGPPVRGRGDRFTMKLRTVSWVMLTVLGSFVLLASFLSTYLAYRGDYAIGGTAVGAVASGRQGLLLALRGIRGTSAAFAAAYAVLFLSIVLGPYKRGETWARWSLLGALVLLCLLVVLRVPLLGAHLGVAPALLQCGIGVAALLLDVSRLRSAQAGHK